MFGILRVLTVSNPEQKIKQTLIITPFKEYKDYLMVFNITKPANLRNGLMRKLRLILLVCLAPATGLAGANAEKIDPDDWVMFGCRDSILDTNYDSGPIYQRVNQLHTAVKKI